VAHAALERRHRLGGLVAVEDRKVHRRVEGALPDQASESARRPVAREPRHPAREGVRQSSPVEQGDAVAAGEEAEGQLVADETVAADDEDVHVSARGERLWML
jgi:hypothetical protein